MTSPRDRQAPSDFECWQRASRRRDGSICVWMDARITKTPTVESLACLSFHADLAGSHLLAEEDISHWRAIAREPTFWPS